MLTGSGVLGAARTVTADGTELAAGTNIGPGAGAFVAGSTLQYTGAFTVTDADVSVRALDLNNFAAGLFSVTGDISLGSVVDTGGANKLAVNIDDGLTLTLTGTGTAAYGANPALLFQGGQAAANNTYTALGNITLGGANAGLTIASDPDVLGPITLAGNIDGGGIITANTDAAINGTIGNTNPAAQISIGASTLSLGGAVIKATTTKLTNAASVLTLTNANAVLTGAVDNTTGGDDVGVLNLNGALSQVTGNIGNTNSLATISVGAGTATLGGAVIKATTTKLTNAASVLTLTNAVLTGAVDNTTGGDNVGVVNLNGALSQVTGNIGNTNSLATINIGAGVATLDGAVIKATTTKLTDDASVLIFTNPVVVTGAIDNTGNANKGVVIFTGASTVTDNIGNTAALAEVSVGAGLLQIQGGVVKANAINLTDNASAVTFTNPVTVTGAIDNTGNANNGVVTFTVDSTVTGSIGGTELFATVNIGAGITLQAGGSLAANNIDFGAASNLEFNGPAGKNYNLIGTIANGNNATLNINAAGTVIANDVSIGTVAQINIQNNKIFVINAKNADVDILDAQAISFKGAASRLFLANVSTTDDRVITLKNHLPGLANGGGELILLSPTKLMTVQGDVGAKTIGTAGNELASLSVLGNVALNNIDATNVPVFNILNITNFVDVGGITNQINVINNGAAGVGPTGGAIPAAAGSYTIDANGGNVGILANGQNINFALEDATLVLQNSAAGNGTITLNAVLDPLAPSKGKLAVDSGAAGGKVILASVGNATYGTAVNKLKELEFRGNGTFQIDTEIFANDLELLVPAITYNKDINSNLSFGVATALTQNGNINGNVDFNNQAAVITLGANKNITDSVTSTGGVNGTIIATGASIINGPITNLAMLKVGAGTVSITKGGNTKYHRNPR